MFQNQLKSNQIAQTDVFDELGPSKISNTSEEKNPYTIAEAINSPAPESTGNHFVHPHEVDAYYRNDGTYVDGYYRDGDGDTSVNTHIEDGGGYNRSNPDDSLLNNLG